jgi:hypothetical protein
LPNQEEGVVLDAGSCVVPPASGSVPDEGDVGSADDEGGVELLSGVVIPLSGVVVPLLGLADGDVLSIGGVSAGGTVELVDGGVPSVGGVLGAGVTCSAGVSAGVSASSEQALNKPSEIAAAANAKWVRRISITSSPLESRGKMLRRRGWAAQIADYLF